MPVNPTTKVYRAQVIEGVSIPAIIHNSSYFFVDIDVYEDGRVSCWNFEDFEHFKQDVKRGWVACSIPDHRDISIHGLGSWTISHGRWEFNEDSFIEYVFSLIKKLNPRLENIYTYRQKVINGVKISDSANGSIYMEHKKTPNDIFPDKIDGKGVNLFYKLKEEYYLIKVVVFADQTIHLTRLPTTEEITFIEFEALINKGIIVSDVPVGAAVNIYGLGYFTIQEAQYTEDIKEKLLEVKDIINELKGAPSSIDICQQAYQEYINQPTAANKERLKISYEQVPDHQKMYIGDMDTKDVAVRMIIYGEQEIENWSHYQAAKAMGLKLPTISIPTPKEGNRE